MQILMRTLNNNSQEERVSISTQHGDIVLVNNIFGLRVGLATNHFVYFGKGNSSHLYDKFKPKYSEIIIKRETEEELIQAAKDELIFLWNNYGQAHDMILTKGARELKRKVLALLERID